ncbi:MAG: GIY-YIG nuclease family protein [Alphaproteobacteria bacterium]|nr:GIY-YIG nuclease family protein [Alphaproteobacteria bacterium]
MKDMYVYIMTNQHNTTLYIGVTNNLVRRIWEHKNKIHKGFTAKYNLNKLVYYEHCEDELAAIAREKQLKLLRKQKKIDLVCGFNPNWVDLYDSLI